MGTHPPLSTRATYWHLEGQNPSDYEIVSSRLLYYLGRGFEVSPPLAHWVREHQQGSRLVCTAAETFCDPRETTYESYTALQARQEDVLDDLLVSIEDSDYDRKLSRPWLRVLSRVLGPVRYPLHGLQMLACYVGHMAPAGRVVIPCAMQAGDEIRRLQRIAYRIRQLQEVDPGFASDAAQCWQREAHWQPLRELLERLLVTYDWGEALVALNGVLKPELDAWLMVRFAARAHARGDERLAELLRALNQDCLWHRAWSEALLHTLVAAEPVNAAVVNRWVETWRPATRAALRALDDGLSDKEQA